MTVSAPAEAKENEKSKERSKKRLEKYGGDHEIGIKGQANVWWF